MKQTIYFQKCEIGIEVELQLPDLSFEQGPQDKIRELQASCPTFRSVERALLAVESNEQAEQAIEKYEQGVIAAYKSADVASYVMVRPTKEETEKAVKVRVKVRRGEAIGTSQFWVPRAALFEHGDGHIVSKWLVERKIDETHQRLHGTRLRGVVGKPVEIIYLPEVDWGRIFADLRAQIPPNIEELVEACKQRHAKADEAARARNAERQRTLPARIEASRLEAAERAQAWADADAAERARIAALETVAENVTVSGHDWVGPTRARERRPWRLENASVKRSGSRAYVLNRDGSLFCWKPADKIMIDPPIAAPAHGGSKLEGCAP